MLLRIRNFSEKLVEKIKTHILYSILFYENRAVYEIIYKIYGRAGQTKDNNII